MGLCMGAELDRSYLVISNKSNQPDKGILKGGHLHRDRAKTIHEGVGIGEYNGQAFQDEDAALFEAVVDAMDSKTKGCVETGGPRGMPTRKKVDFDEQNIQQTRKRKKIPSIMRIFKKFGSSGELQPPDPDTFISLEAP
mmetsp:Transcript_7005/g.9925  ORF Transcript_7005/g.9925 Transcript_7005/m.9925 type:complete len:139 (+) Transcript_7005:177-593(+)